MIQNKFEHWKKLDHILFMLSIISLTIGVFLKIEFWDFIAWVFSAATLIADQLEEK